VQLLNYGFAVMTVGPERGNRTIGKTFVAVIDHQLKRCGYCYIFAVAKDDGMAICGHRESFRLHPAWLSTLREKFVIGAGI
jgi:hypothetical protein